MQGPISRLVSATFAEAPSRPRWHSLYCVSVWVGTAPGGTRHRWQTSSVRQPCQERRWLCANAFSDHFYSDAAASPSSMPAASTSEPTAVAHETPRATIPPLSTASKPPLASWRRLRLAHQSLSTRRSPLRRAAFLRPQQAVKESNRD